MFPMLMQPFSSIARANVQTCLRAYSSFADGLHQINNLNVETARACFSDGAENGFGLPAMFAQFSPITFGYGTGVLSIIGATTSGMLDALSDHALFDRDDAPRLVLLDGRDKAESEIAILDANGNAVNGLSH